MTLRALLALLALILWGTTLPAQETAAEDPTEAEAVEVDSPAAVSDETLPIVDDAWSNVALLAERAVTEGDVSTFRLERLRADLVEWRDKFLTDQDQNAGRVATVQAQIDALGTVAEGEEPIPVIEDRRAALQAQLDDLLIPRRLAQEGFARADGLISEIDTVIRARDTATLTERGSSPLNPELWGGGWRTLGAGLATAVGNFSAQLSASIGTGAIWERLPLAVVYLGVALLLLVRGRPFVERVERRVEASERRSGVGLGFLLSLGQIVIPVVGLIAVLMVLAQLRLLQGSGEVLSEAFFGAGLMILFAHWLNGRLFPTGPGSGPLNYDEDTRLSIRRYGIWLGIGLAVVHVMEAVLGLAEPVEGAHPVVLFPLQVVLAVLLFLLGRGLRTPPMNSGSPFASEGRVRSSIGRLCTLVAVATPVLAVLGYGVAADFLFQASVLTLAILGVVLVLQRLVYDLFTQGGTEDEGDAGPLLPVLIGFGLLVVALPFLALVWGARPADLWEVWNWFREGIALGETRISPTDLLTFLLVFTAGYLLTRFIQSTLRKSVLPRTRLDLGGQNAVVAGLGYVGIFIAAIVAITAAGIDLSNLAIVAGALSVGIGFGLQNIVQNFVSGIILLIERPIGEGDMIEVNGQMGYVKDISVRSTRIETFDRTDVIIPNADLVSGQVTNWTRGNSVGRLILPVGVAYGTDVKQVTDILMEVAMAHPMVLHEPPPQVLFMAFGASSLDFEVRVILRDVAWKLITASEMNHEINARFAEAGIEIPFAQHDLWLRNPDALRKEGEPE